MRTILPMREHYKNVLVFHQLFDLPVHLFYCLIKNTVGIVLINPVSSTVKYQVIAVSGFFTICVHHGICAFIRVGIEHIPSRPILI